MTLAISETAESLIDNSNKKCGGQTINACALRERDNAATNKT